LEKTITKRSDINSLADLVSYRKQLQNEIVLREQALSTHIKAKLPALPWLLLKQKSRTYTIKDGKLDFSGLKNKVAIACAHLVKRALPKKMSFVEKWLLGFVTKKAVNKLLIRENVKPNPIHTQFVPLPIAMKPDVINSPKGAAVHAKTATATPKEKISLKGIWGVLKDSFAGFGEHKVTKISGSLAYYTVFSMAPLMVMVIALCSVFLKREAAEGEIFLQLKGFLGADTAAQLQGIIKNAAIGDKGVVASIIGGVTLLIGATSIFADIQDSINTIWGIKPKPKRGWLKMLQNRFLSFSVIISLGFLLLVSLGVSAILDGFSNRLQARFKDVSVIVFYILNTLITFGVVSSIFAVIFRLLPDAKIRWRDVMSGAMVTAVLFMVGKLAISFYIGQSDVGGTYGAAGSLVILLLWAYYSSIILYFGAEFTKAYAVKYGAAIHPNAYAVTTKEVEVEQGSATIQQNEKSK
jgi:YihY family inner membrane protein